MVKKQIKKDKKECCKWHHSNCGGAFYGLGFIGAAIYFISTAVSFWGGVLGILKALIWPVFLIYELFKFLAI